MKHMIAEDEKIAVQNHWHFAIDRFLQAEDAINPYLCYLEKICKGDDDLLVAVKKVDEMRDGLSKALYSLKDSVSERGAFERI